jgi:hypothetical protein
MIDPVGDSVPEDTAFQRVIDLDLEQRRDPFAEPTQGDAYALQRLLLGASRTAGKYEVCPSHVVSQRVDGPYDRYAHFLQAIKTVLVNMGDMLFYQRGMTRAYCPVEFLWQVEDHTDADRPELIEGFRERVAAVWQPKQEIVAIRHAFRGVKSAEKRRNIARGLKPDLSLQAQDLVREPEFTRARLAEWYALSPEERHERHRRMLDRAFDYLMRPCNFNEHMFALEHCMQTTWLTAAQAARYAASIARSPDAPAPPEATVLTFGAEGQSKNGFAALTHTLLALPYRLNQPPERGPMRVTGAIVAFIGPDGDQFRPTQDVKLDLEAMRSAVRRDHAIDIEYFLDSTQFYYTSVLHARACPMTRVAARSELPPQLRDCLHTLKPLPADSRLVVECQYPPYAVMRCETYVGLQRMPDYYYVSPLTSAQLKMQNQAATTLDARIAAAFDKVD